MNDRWTPVPQDKFSFGLWTVGWRGVDVFGGAVRDELDPVEAVERLAGLGAAGITFHDDDLVPNDATRERTLERFSTALAENNMAVDMATTNLFSSPVFKDGGFTSNDREVRRYALAKAARNIDLGARMGAKTYVALGRTRRRGVRGSEGHPRGAGPAARGPRPSCAPTSASRATTSGSPSSRSPTSRVATSCCRPSGMRWPSSPSWTSRRRVGLNPEVGHEEMAGLNYAHGIAQALWQGKLFHIDLNGQNGPRFDQDLRFGAGNARGAFWAVDVVEGLGGRAPRYDGFVHFDYKPPRTEDADDVWETARANMRNYLILRDKVRAFRADPEVQQATDGLQGPRAVGVDARARRDPGGPAFGHVRPRWTREAGHALRAPRPAGTRVPVRRPLIGDQAHAARHSRRGTRHDATIHPLHRPVGRPARSRRSPASPPDGATTASRSPAGATTSTPGEAPRTTPTSQDRLDILEKYNLKCWAISNHLKGQAVCDDPIDQRHQDIVGPKVWGDGDPEGVRQRAAEEMKHTARTARRTGRRRRSIGFTGSSIWKYVAMFPPVTQEMVDAGYQRLRRPLEPDPRRVRRGGGAVRPRGAPVGDRLRLLDDRAHPRGHRPPPGLRPQLGSQPLRVAGPRPGRIPAGTSTT